MKSLQVWKDRVWNTRIDLDNGSLDCVDVSKSWAEYLYDEPWTKSLSWGNAKDLYPNVSANYWERIPGNQRPEPGWIFVSNGLMGGGYGHTGVVVSVDGDNFTIFQQDTFKQVPVYTGVFSWRSNYVQGFLKPRKAYSIGKNVPLEAYQRQTVNDVVLYRDAPNRAGKVLEKFDPNVVVNFKGWIRGESIDGNNIWFVGRFTNGYSWSGAYTDSGTHDLADLNVAATKPTERQVGKDAMNVRSAADLTVNNVVDLKQPGSIVNMKGYVRGQAVDNIDIWFVTEDGRYIWSGGFTNQTTDNLSDLTPKPPVTDPSTPTPVVTYPAPTTDPLVTKVVNKKNPLGSEYAPTDLVGVGNGQTLRKEAAASLLLMQAAAKATSNVNLNPASGYRTYATQATIYAQYVAKDGQTAADTYSARAGYSEHQTGLTMDFAPIADDFRDTAASVWLLGNAHKFGWILRYPVGKESVTGYTDEPWHWRYVGVTVATDMQTKGIRTLEEYYGIKGGLYADQEPSTPDPKPTDPDNPTPEPEQPKPEDPNKDAKAEAAKLLGRQGLLAAISALIAAIADWVVLQLVGFNLPGQISVGLAGVVYAALLYIDKWIHENAKTKLKGIIPF